MGVTAAPSISISTLGGSLLALSVAGKESGVTPSPFGNNVSCGGIFNRAYEVLYWFGGTPLRTVAVQEALVKSHEAFHSHVDQVKAAHATYMDYLQRVEDGKTYDDEEVFRARLIISDWNNAILPPKDMSLEKMMQKANKNYARFLKDAPGKSWFSKTHTNLVQYQSLFEKIARAQHIIDFEEYVEAPFPFKVLRKLCDSPRAELGVEELDTLKQWIGKVNLCSNLRPHEMHQGLKAAVEHMGLSGTCRHNKPSALAILEFNLKFHGISSLGKPDSKHIRWRRTLETSKSITINGKTYELENRLGDRKKNTDIDEHWVFPLRDDNHSVLVVNASESSLLLDAVEALANPSVIPMAMLKQSDLGGKCALYERLKTPLLGYSWATRDGDIASRDSTAVKSLRKLLNQIAAMDVTPDTSVKDLMFDSRQRIRLTRRLEPGKRFDFNAIIRLAYEASNESLGVFRELLRKCEIGKHSLVDFYKNVVKDAAAADKSKGTDVVAWRHEVVNALVMDQAKDLHRKVRKMLNRCYDKLTGRYSVPPYMRRQQVEEEIAKSLVVAYEDSVGGGILWPKLDDQIIPAAAKALELSRR
ncbi:MAG: hypothetical protein Q8K75_09840 [Chlamydiales bacterium]|nr:hypothetical protein [Chlamydiales bacterium]